MLHESNINSLTTSYVYIDGKLNFQIFIKKGNQFFTSVFESFEEFKSSLSSLEEENELNFTFTRIDI